MASALWKNPSIYLALVLASALGIWGIEVARADDEARTPEQQQMNRISIAREARDEAAQILDRALANPGIYDSPAAQNIYRARQAIYDQYFNIIAPDTAEYYQVCFGPSAVDGRTTSYAGFVNTGSCATQITGSAGGTTRCTVNICPPAFSGTNLTQVIIHEVVHTLGIYNECTTEGTALWALRLGGGAMHTNAYTSACRLGYFFE